MIDVSMDNGNPKEEEALFWFEYYEGIFELDKWEIHIKFGEMPEDVNSDIADADDEDQQYKGTCWSRPEYRKAHIDLDVTLLPLEEIRTYCRHEMIHIVNGPSDNAVTELARTKGEEEYARTSLESVADLWEKLNFWESLDLEAIEDNSLRRKELAGG